MSRRLRIAVYGEINMNLIDGSSVWLQSVVETLAHVGGAEVVLLLRFPEERDLLTRSLHDASGVEVVDPRSLGHTEPLSEMQAFGALEELDARDRFDLVLLRGSRVSEEACGSPSLAGRLWLYYLPPDGASRNLDQPGLEVLAEGASRILCQTEAVRASVEAAVPGHAGKLILLPPMIPAPVAPGLPRGDPGPLRLVYAGKFAPEYRFLEMIELFEQIRERWPDARLDLVGDKIHDPDDDPDFMPTAERALSETRNLVWHGGLTRSKTQELLRAADFGLAIRDAAMSHSLELSTKVLEYGAAGCAVVLNRTPLHEQLLGPDYPLFVRQPADALDALLPLAEDPALRSAAAERCERASLGFTYERVAAGLEPYLPRPVQDRPPTKLVIAGHDLKFATRLRAGLADYAEIEEDLWEGHNEHSKSRSRKLARWADTVLCEWCLGNAVWYSANKAAGQRLVIRFHRVELETGFPELVEHDQVNAWVFVAAHVLEEAMRRFSLPAGKQVVIPNVVDLDRLLRPKLPDATFNLGMIGYVPSLKRVDRALDILEALRASDPRFRLLLKGKPPWEYPWVRRRDEERSYYQEVYGRIARSPLLREAVSFEPFGPNVPAFLQKVRFLVSASDIEGDQVAVAEAAGAAAIPVVLDRPGAVDQYPADWVHPSAELAAEAILRTVHAGETEAAGNAAVEFATGRWSLQSVIPLWADALALGGEPAVEPLRAS